MRFRHVILLAVLAVGSLASLNVWGAQVAVSAPATQAVAATQPVATRPAASQMAIPSDRESIREMISQMRLPDAVSAADAVVKLKLLAKRGVPVWDFLDAGDPISTRQLLTWLRDHPGNIHHPSPLRVEWEAMDVYHKEISSGKSWVMGNAELIEYGRLAREMIRDGDPYGYYALMDVCRTAMERLGRGADQVTFTYVIPFLDRHLDMHVTLNSLKDWKGFWSKPITQKRKFRSPIMQETTDLSPNPPGTPWEIPARVLLAGLDSYRDRLIELGLWQDPPWIKQYTNDTGTADLLKGMIGASFPVRQHICRLLRERMGDAEARKAVSQAIESNHPHARALQLVMQDTLIMPYAGDLRKAWPKALDEQCPGTIDDLLSPMPRSQFEAYIVIQETLLYWPDRDEANRFAIKLWYASGAGANDFSTMVLLTVDNKEGADKLLEVYRKGEVPDRAYNSLHRWVNAGASAFRTACADKDLAPLIVKMTTATQPAVDTSKQDWSQVLRMAYELVWLRLNSDKLYWNEKNNRLEVPQDQLVRPTEDQILAAYSDRGKVFRDMIDAAKTRKVELDPRKQRH